MMKKVFLVFLVAGVFLLCAGCSESSGDAFDFSNVEPKEINPWDYVEDTTISADSTLRGVAASASELGITIGIIGIVFSMFYMVIRIFFTKSAQAKEEIKREAVWKGLIGIMLFSIPFWLGLFKYLSELLV